MNNSHNKTQGFVTIATGNMKYHKMAYTLLCSYKIKAKDPCKFAVITDAPSKYTEYFDDVIITPEATKSYIDKIDLLKNAPYDENIFIDADSIAFGDLNELWGVFKEENAFSCFGKILPNESENGWYHLDKVRNKHIDIKNVLAIHGGVYYIRKDESINKMYKMCKNIIENYSDYGFSKFAKPADEPILALAMAAQGFEPVVAKADDFVWLKRASHIHADFFKGRLTYDFENGHAEHGLFLHFGTSRTILSLYQRESKKVLFLKKYAREWNLFEKIFFSTVYFIKSVVLVLGLSWKRILKVFKI